MLKEPPAAPSPSARTMSKAKSGTAGGQTAPRTVRPEKGPTEAFDVWLQQGLHKLYDSVAQEPIPDDLLELIELDLASRPEKS